MGIICDRSQTTSDLLTFRNTRYTKWKWLNLVIRERYRQLKKSSYILKNQHLFEMGRPHNRASLPKQSSTKTRLLEILQLNDLSNSGNALLGGS